MADGSTYPVRVADNNDQEKLAGNLTFTDSANQPQPGATAVTSVFTRTGAVVATTADYTVGQVTGAAPLASPTFTGTPAAPTAAVDTNTTQLATTAYVVTQAYAKLAGPTFTGTVTVPAAAAVNAAPRLSQLSSYLTLTSGALPNTGAWASGTAKQNPVTRDITVNVAFVTNGTANAATCLIEISPDNVTYTGIGTLTASVGVNTAGAVTLVCPVALPNAWYIKLTFAQGSVAASVYY